MPYAHRPTRAHANTQQTCVTQKQNLSDDVFTCMCVLMNADEEVVRISGTARIFLFIVTPKGAEVDKGDNATLTCTFTGIYLDNKLRIEIIISKLVSCSYKRICNVIRATGKVHRKPYRSKLVE